MPFETQSETGRKFSFKRNHPSVIKFPNVNLQCTEIVLETYKLLQTGILEKGIHFYISCEDFPKP